MIARRTAAPQNSQPKAMNNPSPMSARQPQIAIRLDSGAGVLASMVLEIQIVIRRFRAVIGQRSAILP